MPETTEPATRPASFAAALEAAKLEALYQFAYGLSHEINNPLANIATRAQTLLFDERDPERRRKLATINQQAFRAHEMIADLMLFARPPALRKEPTDLAALADRVVSEMEPLAAEQETTLVRVGPSRRGCDFLVPHRISGEVLSLGAELSTNTLPLIHEVLKKSQPSREGPALPNNSAATLTATVDPTQIAVALAALVQNSLEAIGRGGRVEVSAECGVQSAECWPRSDSVLSTEYSVPSTRAAAPSPIPTPHFAPTPHSAFRTPHFLTVTDTGPGIPPHIRPHIFDPFFSGREAGRGLGLGLSKAWRIVTSHGGTLSVASPESGGAVFTIELPELPHS